MSETSNQIVPIWEAVESTIRRSSIKRRGVQLNTRQKLIMSDALSLNVLAWHDLLSSLDGYCTRWIFQWLDIVMKTDLDDMVRCFKSADSLLLSHVGNEGDYSYADFKRQMKLSSPSSGALLAPLNRALELWFSNYEPESLAVAHGCLAFMTRLNLPGLNDLEEEALCAYKLREQTMMSEGFTTEEQQKFAEWFPVERQHRLYDDWSPSHGPGSSADVGREHGELKTAMSSKYKNIGIDSKLHYLDIRLGDQSLLPRSRPPLERLSKTVFVPKSIDKLRTICMEPVGLMWYQKGFANAIDRIITQEDEDHPGRFHPLKSRIDLRHQEHNQKLAWLGSLHGKFATIDLSAASDSVPWRMVQQWTKTSALRVPLLCTRSSRTVIQDAKETFQTKKFAPMGSALCFPIECLVFAAIVECSIREQGGSVHDSKYRVYGDDIIVEARYAAGVINRLLANGFTVNSAKTFMRVATHNFRESCGGEYLDGVDVTPIRLSRKFSGFTGWEYVPRNKYKPSGEQMMIGEAPSRIVELIDLCNRTSVRLPSVRRRLIAVLNSFPTVLRPLFDDTGDLGIYSPQPTNYHLRPPVWKLDYQIWQVEHGAKESVFARRIPDDEDIRLYEHLRLTAHRNHALQIPEDVVSVCVAPLVQEVWRKITSRLPMEETNSPARTSIRERD